MPDAYGIKDLPDTSKIEDSRVYLVEGKWLNITFSILKQLWRGENVNKGPNIFLRQFGDAGYSISSSASDGGTGGGGSGWPFKVYNTTKGATGQVQINGGDGFAASLNGFVANVNGSPNNVSTGTPPVYPQLSVTGNGVIYGYAVPATAGTDNPLASLDVYYSGTMPSIDTANPATYYPFLLATITGYTVTGGNVSFNVSNVTNYGYTTLTYCGGRISIY